MYPTVATYTREKSGHDCSIDRTIQVELPAPWLADQMGLRMKGGHSPVFVDSDGRTMFMDPSVLEPGPSAALVDRERVPSRSRTARARRHLGHCGREERLWGTRRRDGIRRSPEPYRDLPPRG